MKISVENLDVQSAPFRTPFKFGAAVIDSLRVPVVRLRLSTAAGGGEGRQAGVGLSEPTQAGMAGGGLHCWEPAVYRQ